MAHYIVPSVFLNINVTLDRQQENMTKKVKKISPAVTRYLDSMSVDFQIEYEFDIPNFTGNEKEVERICNKFDLKSIYRIIQDGSPPLKRILVKTDSKTNIINSDTFIRKVDSAISSGNLRMPFSPMGQRPVRCSISSDEINFLYDLRNLGNWVSYFTIEAKLNRYNPNEVTMQDIVSQFKAIVAVGGELSKLKTDPDDIWTMRYHLVPNYYSHVNTVASVQKAITNLNLTNLRYKAIIL